MKNIIFHSASLCLRCDTNIALCAKGSAEMRKKMNFLEERIQKDGIIREGNVLKVDSFLNHQMDIDLFDQRGAEFRKRFDGKPITSNKVQ